MKIPAAALNRIAELQAEQKAIKHMENGGQVGTAVPQLFFAAETFIANPSAVGTGIIARMIETDDTIAASVQFKILMILAKIGDYHHDNPDIAKFVNGYLKKLKGPTWRESMESILSAKGYGFSVSEIVYGLNKNIEKVPVRIPTYHPSTIAFEVDEYGRITEMGILQFVLQSAQLTNPNSRNSGVNYGWTIKNPFTTPTDRLLPYRMPFIQQYGLQRIPRAKVIHFTELPGLSFGSPYGKTPVRTAHLAWQLKAFFMKQIGVAGKRQATPSIHGQAPTGGIKVKLIGTHGEADAEVTPTEALRRMLKNRETDDAIVTGPEKDGYKLTVVDAQANLEGMLQVVNDLNVFMFRCFLLPSLVMTDGSAGSRSLGDKHFQMVDKIASSEAKKFGETIVNDMIEHTVIENFGEQDDYGHFTERPQSVEERQMLSNMFCELGNSGWLKPHVEEDMAYVRNSLNLPKDMDKSFEINPPGNGGDNQDPPAKDDEEEVDDKHKDEGGDKTTRETTPINEDAPTEVLNGAQVTSLVDIVKSVAIGELPYDSAVEIIKAAFNMNDEQAKRILGDAEKFKPKTDSGDDDENKPDDKDSPGSA